MSRLFKENKSTFFFLFLTVTIFDEVEDEEDSETGIVEEPSDLDADEFIAKV